MPTLLDVLKIPYNSSGMHAVSMLSLLTTGDAESDIYTLTGRHAGPWIKMSVLDGDFKLIITLVHNESAVYELYDLGNDPLEKYNLIDDPDYEHVTLSLGEKFSDWFYRMDSRFDSIEPEDVNLDLDDETLEQLKALGYVDSDNAFVRGDVDDCKSNSGLVFKEQSHSKSKTDPIELDFNCPDCNVLLISVETLRADHLSSYGYGRNTTSNIDELARESVVFENAYSQAASTVPALRSIMTGRVISNDNKNDITSFYENTTYLAELFSQKGYQTAGFTDHAALGEKNVEADFSIHYSHTLLKGLSSFESFGIDRYHVLSPVITEGALNWLKNNHREKFFLWLHFNDPHWNYNPLPEYESLFGFSEKDCDRITNGINIKDLRKIQKNLTKKEIDCVISLYDAEVFYTDMHIGKVLDKLKELGLEENTVIVLTADHGEEFRERTRFGHETTLYNELIHVPLIVKIPKNPPAKVKENIGTLQIFYMLSNLNSTYTMPQEETISRSYHFYWSHNQPNKFTIIDGDYKYIHNPTEGWEEFYDLKKDALEKNNILCHPRKEYYKQKLLSWIDENNLSLSAPSEQAIKSENELIEKLKKLGYGNSDNVILDDVFNESNSRGGLVETTIGS